MNDNKTWKCPDCGDEVHGTRLVRHYYKLTDHGRLADENNGLEEEEDEAYACPNCGRTWEEWEDFVEAVFDINQ